MAQKTPKYWAKLNNSINASLGSLEIEDIEGGGDSLPSQSGHSGEFLTTNGTTLSWTTNGAGDALTTNPLSQFAATTSLQLKGVISDETGSGALVFATSPTLVTPVLGAATATTINGATITSGTLNGSVTGTNTGDQTTIVGITGTKAQFDTAVTDGNFLYVGDVSANVTKVGAPVNNQVGVWTGDGTIEGDANLTWDATSLIAGASSTVARLSVKGDNTNPVANFEGTTATNGWTIDSTGTALNPKVAATNTIGTAALRVSNAFINQISGGASGNANIGAIDGGFSGYFRWSQNNDWNGQPATWMFDYTSTNGNNSTSGTGAHVGIIGNFKPTSGTAVYADLAITSTYNQTGGANGQVRGIYIAPTLTAVGIPYRAIESTVGQVKITDTTVAGSGSLTGSLLDLAQTWNTTGTPTAIKLNVTDTASNAASLLMDLQVGGTSAFSVRKDSSIGIGKTYTATADVGWAAINSGADYSGLLSYANGGFAQNSVISFLSADFRPSGSGNYGALRGLNFTVNNNGTSTSNLIRAAYISARNNAASSRAGTLVGTRTEAISDNSTGGTITTAAGLDAYVAINTAGPTITNAYGVRVDDFTNAGTITNTYGIYVGDITVGTQTNQAYGIYVSDANARNFFAGDVQINGLTRYGGTTSSFPALKRSSATIQARLADDSAYALVKVSALDVDGTVSSSTDDQTIDKAAGSFMIDAGTSNIVITNSYVTTTSLVFAQIMTDDSTARIKCVVADAGGFIVKMLVAPTAETRCAFLVINV